MASAFNPSSPPPQLCLIPLDSRPVCYDLPRQLAAIAGIELSMPPKEILGHLKTPADWPALKDWLTSTIPQSTAIIVALDTIAYGGLISSRLGNESLEDLNTRLYDFYSLISHQPVLAFSSIMRIPHYNNAEEEPDYWGDYGERLYDYSLVAHQHPKTPKPPESSIPAAVLSDFLARRDRNFKLNMAHLTALKNGQLHQLVFCQDDTGEFGLNVLEAQKLQQQINTLQLDANARIQTGADEVASCFFSQWLLHTQPHLKPPTIYPCYSNPDGKHIVPRYDGLAIETLVAQKIAACGAEAVSKADEASLILAVHPPYHNPQPDHIMDFPKPPPKVVDQRAIREFKAGLDNGDKMILADLAYANGSDPQLGEALILQHRDFSQLYGYAGWNTAGNTLGTAIAMGCVRWFAEQTETFNKQAFRELMVIRWVDDWLYQAQWRQKIRQETGGQLPDTQRLNALISLELALIQQRFKLNDYQVHLGFPCGRLFEIEVQLTSQTKQALIPAHAANHATNTGR